MNLKPRQYLSPVREEQARRTERRITGAAHDLFLQHGYGPTTVTAIARSAGVSTQTIYNVFGSKSGLLAQVYSIALTGDDEHIDPQDRQAIRALDAEQDPDRIIAAYAQLSHELAERLGQLHEVVRVATADDAELTAALETAASQRLYGAERVAQRLADLGVLRTDLDPDLARDLLWALTSIELWQSLTRERQWSGQTYRDWITGALRRELLA